MAKVIIYQNSEGGASIVRQINADKSIEDIAKKAVPDGTAYEIVEDSQVPTDRTFRTAWVKGSGVVTEDVTKSKVIAHGTRREKRSVEFKPHDDTISLNIPGTDTSAAETARAAIRTKYATMQTNIDNATNIAGIKTALGG
jgi:hypothetical protein